MQAFEPSTSSLRNEHEENEGRFPNDFQEWRNALVQTLLYWVSGIALFAFAAASYYSYVTGNYYLIAIYWSLYAFLIAVTFSRRISYHVRIGLLIGLLYAAVLLNYFTEGRGSLARIFLLVLCFVASLFWGKREALLALAGGLLTMAGFGWAFSQGLITGYTEVDSTIISGWLSNGLFFTVLGVFTVLSIDRIFAHLAATLRQSRRLAHDLETERLGLEQQVRERTQRAEQARSEAEVANKALQDQMWRIGGQAQLAQRMRGEQDLPTLARNIIEHLCRYVGAAVGALYWRNGEVLELLASYAFSHRKRLANRFRLGEGIVGQAALEKQTIVLENVPREYLAAQSGLAASSPATVLVVPFILENEVVGVVELATASPLQDRQRYFVESLMENIAVAFVTARTRQQVSALLVETRRQADILREREEELRAINEELEAQAENLRISEGRLRENQATLESTNVALEEKAAALEESTQALREQQAILDEQNRQLKLAQQELEKRAEALAQASRYKSEFLANMSHELRTPLNSLLILTRMLADNEEGNLTPEQVESTRIIYNSGRDLLDLINAILDLSKVEAGRMEFSFAPLQLEALVEDMRAQFAHVAR
ncbi:MAG: GAF domain-containing protein, partial [Anaerolineae bacterium]|nr:GAF domain-containing protein [Anaerolineae bacterium]